MALPVGPVNPFSVGKLVPTGPSSPDSSSGGSGFGRMLADSIGKLDQAQAGANQQVQDLATGKAKDLSTVVMSVEQASLEVQLAAQIRNKAVDAYNDIFRMQI